MGEKEIKRHVIIDRGGNLQGMKGTFDKTEK
jgi:hypothetical protein